MSLSHKQEYPPRCHFSLCCIAFTPAFLLTLQDASACGMCLAHPTQTHLSAESRGRAHFSLSTISDRNIPTEREGCIGQCGTQEYQRHYHFYKKCFINKSLVHAQSGFCSVVEGVSIQQSKRPKEGHIPGTWVCPQVWHGDSHVGFHTQTHLCNAESSPTSSFHAYCQDEESQQPGGSWSFLAWLLPMLCCTLLARGVFAALPRPVPATPFPIHAPLEKNMAIFPQPRTSVSAQQHPPVSARNPPSAALGPSIFSHLLSGRVLLPIYLSIIFIEKSALVPHSYMS